jgi:hypothetical protein
VQTDKERVADILLKDGSLRHDVSHFILTHNRFLGKHFDRVHLAGLQVLAEKNTPKTARMVVVVVCGGESER